MTSRKKRGRPAKLSRTLIIDAASGMDLRSLSIVKLARSLEVTDAAIYYYFSSRAALIRAVVDQGSSTFEVPDIGTSWWHGLQAYALRVYDALIEKPGAAQFIIGGGVAGPVQMQIFSTVVERLVDAGESRKDAVRIYIVYFRAALYAAFAHDEQVTVGGQSLSLPDRLDLARAADAAAGAELGQLIGDPEITSSRKQLLFLLEIIGRGFSTRE